MARLAARQHGVVSRGQLRRFGLSPRQIDYLTASATLHASLPLRGEFIEVDCLWRRERIALELDDRAAQLRVKRWEADRLRDRRLLAAGWKPARVTDEQLRTGADELDGDLRALGVPARE